MKSVNNILKGKQIGYQELREVKNEKIWFSIAVQKWNSKYKIYFSEIEESQMLHYEDVADDIKNIIEVDTIEEVLEYFKYIIQFGIEELHPLKGEKIFNPAYYEIRVNLYKRFFVIFKGITMSAEEMTLLVKSGKMFFPVPKEGENYQINLIHLKVNRYNRAKS